MDNFETNQNNPALPDVRVLWTGGSVALYKAPDVRRIVACGITANRGLVGKIKSLCVTNGWRCSSIKKNKIWL